MPWLKKHYSIFLWTAFLLVAGYAVYAREAPCEEPITYRLGTVDPGFGVTEDEFLATIEDAARMWESASGRDLFRYDPAGEVVVHLVYDTRQQNTEIINELASDIEATGEVADSVKKRYTALMAEFDAAKRDYEADAAAYNKSQFAYNSRVDYWNRQGGAPAGQYAELTRQKDALSAERQALKAQEAEVQALAGEINALIDTYNLLAEHINANVESINSNELVGTTFEEGLYIKDRDGKRILIYQFDNETFFVRVIAHELGHALGVEHNENPDSIMNPINRSESLALTAEDSAGLGAACALPGGVLGYATIFDIW